MAILHPGGNVIAAREPTGVSELDATLTAIVERAARLAGAEVVIARLADETGGHVAHAVHARSESVRAELEASRIDAASVPAAEETGLEELPQALRLAAERVGAVDVVRLPVTVEPVGEPGWLVTLRLGEPPVGVLQLLIGQEPDPEGPLLPRLATFAVRAAHALRTSEHRRTLAADLDRTRALLTIVGQAIAELSLTHTLDTAVDRVRDLLGVEGLAVYLAEEGGERLETAGERGLTGPHVRIGERLLDLALGPARGRGLVLVEDATADL